jgi:hypothetical protein
MPMVQMPQSPIADRAAAVVLITPLLTGKVAMVHLVLCASAIQILLIWLFQQQDHQQSQHPVDTEFTNGQEADR